MVAKCDGAPSYIFFPKKGSTLMMVVQHMMGALHHNACSSYDVRPSYDACPSYDVCPSCDAYPSYDGPCQLYERWKSLMLNQYCAMRSQHYQISHQNLADMAMMT